MTQTLTQIKQHLAQQKPHLIAKYNIKQLGLFGSWVRGEQREDSDVDILIDFNEYPSLLVIVGIQEELSDYLGLKVDLVMRSGLKRRIGQRILQEVIYL